MTACGYCIAFVGYCQKPTAPGCNRCVAHAGIACCSCGAQATHECSHTMQFVCGSALCDDCEGFEEGPSKPDWSWVIHRHRRKLACERLDARGLPIVRVKAGTA